MSCKMSHLASAIAVRTRSKAVARRCRSWVSWASWRGSARREEGGMACALSLQLYGTGAPPEASFGGGSDLSSGRLY